METFVVKSIVSLYNSLTAGQFAIVLLMIAAVAVIVAKFMSKKTGKNVMDLIKGRNIHPLEEKLEFLIKKQEEFDSFVRLKLSDFDNKIANLLDNYMLYDGLVRKNNDTANNIKRDVAGLSKNLSEVLSQIQHQLNMHDTANVSSFSNQGIELKTISAKCVELQSNTEKLLESLRNISSDLKYNSNDSNKALIQLQTDFTILSATIKTILDINNSIKALR